MREHFGELATNIAGIRITGSTRSAIGNRTINEALMKRIQIVARIDPALRKEVGRLVRRDKTTLNAVIEGALTRYVAASKRPPNAKDV